MTHTDDISAYPVEKVASNDEKRDAVAAGVSVSAADERDPSLIPTQEELRTLPKIPAAMP
jgi:hypothetical protein